MSQLAIDVIAWLLIPAAVLPIVTAWVLRSYARANSPSLRDRWHLSLVLAAIGLVAAFLGLIRVLDLDVGTTWWAVPLGLVLLTADIVSGKWLVDYYNGHFR